jgi:predicted Zn-dependent protease with MMP-like domain
MKRARDRHGRGLRGPLAPPDVPLARTRGERFDDLVLEAIDHVEHRFTDQLARVQFVVADVPPATAPDDDTVAAGSVPLARLVRERATPTQVVFYRRPMELRAAGSDDLAGLVHDVVVEQIATVLGLDPSTVDPGYGEE